MNSNEQLERKAEQIVGLQVLSVSRLYLPPEKHGVYSRYRYFFQLENGFIFELGYYSPWKNSLVLSSLNKNDLALAEPARDAIQLIGRKITDIAISEEWATFAIIFDDELVANVQDDSVLTERLFASKIDAPEIPDDLTSWISCKAYKDA